MADPDGEIEIDEDAAWVAAALVLVAVLGGAVVLAGWPLWGVALAAPLFGYLGAVRSAYFEAGGGYEEVYSRRPVR